MEKTIRLRGRLDDLHFHIMSFVGRTCTVEMLKMYFHILLKKHFLPQIIETDMNQKHSQVLLFLGNWILITVKKQSILFELNNSYKLFFVEGNEN